MPLPFTNNHDGKRKWQCFVCGVLQNSLPDFYSHITNNHEESREYILCPLERCKIPVRDIRAHFKMFHKQESIPKNCQLRCAVWRDPRDPAKKKRKVSFQEGYFISAKNRGKKLHYRSSWEREVYEVLEKTEKVLGYEVEPLAIDYFHEGRRQTYLPDLKVHLEDGSKEIWEIKPMNQTDLSINESKWFSCNQFCKRKGWKFRVVTEVGIGRLKNGVWLD
ncbi:MAG: hypothetical protein KW793_05005 [Candidatus Doudnabacteria bacterium]|nr:hypothetical protein [Candidatus Doudnabacteria bacterium]